MSGSGDDKGMDKGSCACDEKDKKSAQLKEKEIQSQIMFEDYLHNTVYVKKWVIRLKFRTCLMCMILWCSGQAKKKREVKYAAIPEQRFDMGRLSYREFPSETTDKDLQATAQPPTPTQESSLINGMPHVLFLS